MYLYVSCWEETREKRKRERVCNKNSITDELVNEKEKYKNIADEMDQAFSELSGF